MGVWRLTGGSGVWVFGRDVDVGIMRSGGTRLGFPREYIGAHPTVQRAIKTRHGNSKVRKVPGSLAVVGAAVTAPLLNLLRLPSLSQLRSNCASCTCAAQIDLANAFISRCP